MKTSLEIINKLSEKEAVKLDSQLVELGLVDDFKNESTQIIELSKKDIQKVLDALNSAKFQIEVLNEVPKRSVALLNKYKDLEVKAKELGITLPNNLQNIIKELQPLSKINTSKLDGLIKSVVTELNKR
jgi:uncharacterized protein VirK/YbjX